MNYIQVILNNQFTKFYSLSRTLLFQFLRLKFRYLDIKKKKKIIRNRHGKLIDARDLERSRFNVAFDE